MTYPHNLRSSSVGQEANRDEYANRERKRKIGEPGSSSLDDGVLAVGYDGNTITVKVNRRTAGDPAGA